MKLFDDYVLVKLKSKMDAYSRQNGECLECTYAGSRGYANVTAIINGKTYKILAHRLAYYLSYGELNKDMHVCHLCDNPKCINPEHLFQGSARDNVQDKMTKGRCLSGTNHPMAKLTYKEIQEIRLLRGKLSQTKIAEKYKISQTHVSAIHRGVMHTSTIGGNGCDHIPVVKLDKKSDLLNLSGTCCQICGVKLKATWQVCDD